jgi:alpha-beta hydrolase superfamily lysophospholipase
MPSTTISLTSADGLPVTVYRWDPPGTPSGALQITHGMGEHARRYEELARQMSLDGLVVYAQDHRGHGAPGGWAALVADIGLLTRHIFAEHPGLPVILLGHSMGSFAVQQYLLDHSADADAVVLTGTAAIDLLEPALDFSQPLDLTMFNVPFAPARTDYDWLTRDEAIVDAYVADPRCGFGIDPAAAREMFEGARPLADPARVAAMRADLPVYIAAGELDPVNGGLALLTPLADRYRAAGLDVTVRTYPEARHEILNEVNRGEVTADLTAWLKRAVDLGQR